MAAAGFVGQVGPPDNLATPNLNNHAAVGCALRVDRMKQTELREYPARAFNHKCRDLIAARLGYIDGYRYTTALRIGADAADGTKIEPGSTRPSSPIPGTPLEPERVTGVYQIGLHEVLPLGRVPNVLMGQACQSGEVKHNQLYQLCQLC